MGVKVREKVPGSDVWWIFINHQGKRLSKKVGMEKAAREAAKEIEARITLGKEFLPRKKPPRPTLNEQYKHFFKTYLETAVRPSTQSSYETNFRVHILPALGPARLDGITRAKVKDLVASLVSKKLARPTIRIITAQLCALLNQAVEDGIIDTNPAVKLSKFYRNAPVRHEEIQPLRHDEVIVFLETAEREFGKYYAIFLCAIHTGLRTGELIGLQWGDIDFFNKLIVVRRSVVRRRIQATKSDKIRRVDMSDSLFTVLRGLRKKRRQEWLAKGKNEIPEWVFCARNGNFMDPYNLKDRYFYKCLEKAGLRRVRFHDLRHTFATLLIEQGYPLPYIQQQLGHSSIRMTVDVYGHLAPSSSREAVNSLPSPNTPLIEDQAAAD